MDPKQNAQLDPKLQEAYNRVMGTSTTPPDTTAPTPAAPQIMTNPAVSPANAPSSPATLPTPELTQSLTTSTPINPTPVSVAPVSSPNAPLAAPASPAPPPVIMPHSTETVRVGGNTPVDSPSTTSPTVIKEKKKGISPVIIVVGALVFLLVYTLFWVKFLNVPLPFLSQ